MKLVRETIENIVLDCHEPTEEQTLGMRMEKGYEYQEVSDTLQEFSFTVHIRSCGAEAKCLKKEADQRARCWVVERTHNWMNRFRRILTRWEEKAENHGTFLYFACVLIANLFTSLWTAFRRVWGYFPLFSLTFAILHLSYGFGFPVGLIKFWNCWGNKSSKVL